jgi:hypothetical protein
MTTESSVADTEQALASLLDVSGVEGGFLVSASGELAAWNMPPLFAEELLDEVSGKLSRLREAFAVVGEELDFCVARFVDYKLCLKAAGAGMLCVLARLDADVAALRMATRLVLHRVGVAGQE